MTELNTDRIILDNKLNLERVVFKIKYNRAHLGISQQEMAKKLDISHRKYQRIEALESSPSLEMLFSLSQILKIKFSELSSPEVPNFIPENFEILNLSEDSLKTIFESTKSSNFFDLANNGEIESVINSNFQEILKLDSFMESNYPLYLSDYNTTYLNPSLRKITNRPNDSKPTYQGWKDKKTFAQVWDMFTCFDIKYSKVTSEIKTPAGEITLTTLNRTFKNSSGKPYVFGTF